MEKVLSADSNLIVLFSHIALGYTIDRHRSQKINRELIERELINF